MISEHKMRLGITWVFISAISPLVIWWLMSFIDPGHFELLWMMQVWLCPAMSILLAQTILLWHYKLKAGYWVLGLFITLPFLWIVLEDIIFPYTWSESWESVTVVGVVYGIITGIILIILISSERTPIEKSN